MLIILHAGLRKPELSADYRPAILSFLKYILQETSPELYRQFYTAKNPVMKAFTFAVKLPNPTFSKDKILLSEPQIQITFSSNCFSEGIDLYNAMLNHRQKPYPFFDNAMTVKSVRLENHPALNTDHAAIQFLSPLVVREHEKGCPDRYYAYGDDGFETALEKAVGYQLERLAGITLKPGEFSLSAVKSRRTVVRSFGTCFRCSLGTYRLSAPPEVLSALFTMGMGSRRSQGFGMFQILS